MTTGIAPETTTVSPNLKGTSEPYFSSLTTPVFNSKCRANRTTNPFADEGKGAYLMSMSLLMAAKFLANRSLGRSGRTQARCFLETFVVDGKHSKAHNTLQ
jgi:hypothetical protein